MTSPGSSPETGRCAAGDHFLEQALVGDAAPLQGAPREIRRRVGQRRQQARSKRERRLLRDDWHGGQRDAAEAVLAGRGVGAPIMVVRGNGSLASADFVRERPVETILWRGRYRIQGALAAELDR